MSKKVERMSWLAVIILSQVLLASYAEDQVEPKVFWIQPHYGSYEGATRLYIHGQGFSSSGNLQSASGQDQLGNKAYLKSDFETVPCDVENDASHETMIVCYTRPMKVGRHYYIEVEVDGEKVPFKENCNNSPRSGHCAFSTRNWRTPYIRSCQVEEDGVDHLRQTAFAPGGLITCSGRIFTQIYGSNDQLNENERTVSIRKAQSGGQTCELLKEPDVFYGLNLTNGDEGYYTCKPRGTFIGLHNVSLILADDFGRSAIANEVKRTSGKDKVYHFQTYAEIIGVSPQVGSLEGGTRVTIEGRYFDNTTVGTMEVFIGGIPCEIVDGTATANKVECIAGKAPPEREYYTGSRGVIMETWSGEDAEDTESRDLSSGASNYESLSVIDSSIWKWNDDMDNFVGKFTGVFIVPKTDQYKFKVAGDDKAWLYVNCEGNKDDLTRLAYTDKPVWNHRTYWHQSSDWMFLEEGQECYFVSTIKEYGGGAYLTVGVLRASTTLTLTQSYDAKNEIQYVDFIANYDDEKQAITFNEWSTQTGVAEVQEITVEHSCIAFDMCDQVGYRLKYEGVTTQFITADASASTVRNALREILALSDEDVDVSKDTESGGLKYTVTFNEKRGDYSLLQYEKYPAGVVGLTIAIEETTKGVADRTKYKLRIAERLTSPLDANANAKAIGNALNDTRKAHCPSYLLPDPKKNKNTVVTTIDYESTKYGEEWGNRRQDSEPFCGMTSSKNPEYIYYSGRTSHEKDKAHKDFDAHTYKYICLGHRGLMGEDIHLTGTFKRSGGNDISGTHSFKNPLETHETEWRYSCIDLMEVIQSRDAFSDVDRATLRIVRFLRKGHDYDYFLDAITIGREKVSNDVPGIAGLRTPPALADGFPIEKVLIEEGDTENSYEVVIKTYECGQVPLLSMAYIATSSSGTDQSTQREDSWETGSSFQTARLTSGTDPMTGTFDLTVKLNDKSYDVPHIPVNITANKLAQRLESEVTGFGQAGIHLRGACHARDYRIEWLTNGGDKLEMEARMENVIGAATEVHVRTYEDGGVLHFPITGDMLRLPNANPQVELFVNGFPSKCTDSCDFVTSEDATPVISLISPSSGSANGGTVVTITGSNLGAIDSNSPTTVNIGEANCEVSASSDTSITCNLESGQLGTFDVVINVGGKGFARKQSDSVSLSFSISGGITAIEPASGFSTGGTEVVISGYGFTETTVFSFASSACDVVNRTSTEVICIAPSNSAGLSFVTAEDNGINYGNVSFEYVTPDASFDSVSPTTSTLKGGENLTIAGSNIGQDGVLVKVGGKHCDILQTATNEIVCSLPSSPNGYHAVMVFIPGKGYASGSATVTYKLEVNSVSTDVGSINGGTKIVVGGDGFVEGETEIKFGDALCDIDSITPTQVECTTQKMTKTYKVTVINNQISFSWHPKNLEIEVGDTVVWEWNIDRASGGWNYGVRVFTTATSDSDEYDNATFESSAEKVSHGVYSYMFTNEGTYYISSGKVDHPDWGTNIMKGSVIVGPSQAKRHRLTVLVAGHEASYDTASSSSGSGSSCTGSVNLLNGCVPGDVETGDSSFFSLVSDTCYTPKITSISHSNGTSETVVTITGVGFGDENCANKVIIGDGYMDEYDGEIISSSSTQISFKPNPVDTTRIYAAFYVKVSVDKIGDSINEIQLDLDRRFTLLPSFTSVNPISGSTAGETLITIAGSGFPTEISFIEVLIGNSRCDVQSATYFEIKCLTASSSVNSLENVTVTPSGQDLVCTGTCQFMYSDASTPTVTSMTPTTVDSADTIAFIGTGFGSEANDILITLGDTPCDVETANSTHVSCTLYELPAGRHDLQMKILGKGKAKLEGASDSMLSSAMIDDMNPTNGSNAGGTQITLTGNGFRSDDIEIKIGENLCDIDYDTLTNFEVTCITPAKSSSGSSNATVSVTSNGVSYIEKSFEYSDDMTPTIVSISPQNGDTGDIVYIIGTLFDPSNMVILIGNAACDGITGNSSHVSCTLQDHAGGEYPVSATVGTLGFAEADILFNYTFAITSVSPVSGSFGGGNLTISGQGFSNQSEIKVCDSVCHFDNSQVSKTEIKCTLSKSSENTASDKLCDITISVDGQTVTKTESYNFTMDKTPKITGVTPDRGGTQGGTDLTITGTLFDPDHTKVSVSIGGVNCTVTSSTDTEIHCTTNSRGQSLKAEIEVNIDGKGSALNDDNLQFYYVDVWSSTWTWGGLDPPVAGDFVVVPAGQTLVLDIDTPILKVLLIRGGAVIFDEKDIHLQAENILITEGGILQVGTEESPFEHKAIITLHGHLRSPELPIYGAKSIGVRNGTLDLHGKHIPITWTRLAETAASDTSTLHLQHAVTWEVGDEIVVASTGLRHSQGETETAFIQSISDNGTILALSKPLKYTHISNSETFEGVTLETRAEVALLTRNVVVRGAKHMQWAADRIPRCTEGFNTGEFSTQTCFQGRFGEEEGSDQFGAQIMIHHRSPNLDIARARIEYVELTHVGQAFRLGRYPIHFHLLGDVHFNNYVRGCAIHHSFNRAVTIHNTHHLLVEHNVVYNIMGGAMFIEDGIEHGNKIQYNLVLFCKQSTSLQNDDITPAAFWVTNPNNTIQHNVAAGGTHFGFWYRIHEHPDGPSADTNICQQRHPVEMFQNNTVHSQGWFGLWVFQKYTPRGDGSCGANSPNIAKFNTLTAWNCEKGAELVNVGAIQFHNFIMAHNEKAGIETKLVVDKKVQWGQVGTYDSFIIAHASTLPEGIATDVGMILPFSEGYEVKNTKFINFDQDGSAAIGVTKIDGTCTVLCGGWEARFSEISYENSPNKGKFRWEHEVILRDLDGTLSETGAHSVITPFNPTISATDCSEAGDFSVGSKKGVICDGSVKFHRVSWNTVRPTSLEAKDVSFSTSDGTSFVPFAKKRLTHKFGWMGTMMGGYTYRWVFQDAEHLTNISYHAGFYNFEENDCVIVAHNLTQKPDRFFVVDGSSDEQDENAVQDDMVSCNNNYHGDYYFDAGAKILYYIVSGRNRATPKKGTFSPDTATPNAVHRFIKFKVYRCYYEKCLEVEENSEPPERERPEEYQIWHNSSFWKMNENGEYVGTTVGDGTTSIPPSYQDIRIENGTWMVINQNLNPMNKLWIEGTLEIEGDDDDLEVTFSATHIMILGGRLIVGWDDNFFQGKLDIVLRGNHDTEDIVMNGEINLGSKAIGVIGGLDLHGLEKGLRKTHLASQLRSGSNNITVVDPPTGWAPGDEIVIASTSADPWETETFKITAINDNTITLNASAVFDHMAETFNHSDDGVQYDIRAEVGILTRNIRIIGEDYSDLFEESFGARILIAGTGNSRGYARIQNVEFFHTGQEGWIDNDDPRYSLAFMNTGQVNSDRPSFVRRNTFHNGFNTALGVFGASGLELEDNVIHHTVGPGIRVEGTNITLTDNLVMLARTRSVYQDRFEDDLMLWKAAIEVNLAESPVLINNVVVGSERGGYRINGHDCDPESETETVEWGWNTARATLHGIFMNKDGYPLCTHISKFHIHTAYDNGIYYQGSGNLKISDVLVTDSNFGITGIVFSPKSVGHHFREKHVSIANSTVVAVSKPDYCPSLDSGTDYLKNSKKARCIRRTHANDVSRAGIMWPAFISGHNAAPSKPFVGSLSYPAIGGKTTVKNVTFVNFGDASCSPNHTVFLTNLKIEDFLHPIISSELKFVNSPQDTRVFFHRPSIAAINPSDCVDMECDGMKKALLVDEDGTLLGLPGSVIPQAENEWDGDSRRGLGDYRIPRTLLTNLDGGRVDIDDTMPNKGILRANTNSENCTAMDAWHGHACHGYNHGILVIESLDADSETRRLSPVALVADKYVDLNNGPQDHGWCAGYTCQERLSTFWTIVALGKSYELHFSGTAPQKLRLRLLNEPASTKMMLKLFYTRPQRLDVFVDDSLREPEGNDGIVIDTAISYEQYYPTLNNFPGDNFHDPDTKLMHITLAGDTVFEVHEAYVVVLKFYLPSVSPDEFFDNGRLVKNLAAFLNILESKIRFVRAVREGVTLGRRRRNTDSYEVTVEVGNEPQDSIANTSESTTAATSSTPMTPDELARTTAQVTDAMQNGTLGNELETEVQAVGVIDARNFPVRNPNITDDEDDAEATEVLYQDPGGLKVLAQPSDGYAGSTLSPTLNITGIGANGQEIVLGHWGNPWHATVTIVNGDEQAVLSGVTIAKFENGYAVFENLTISRPGSYVLRIQVTYPVEQSNLTVITDPFTLNDAIETTAASVITTTKTTVTTTTEISTAVSNLAVVIACAVVAALLLAAIVTVIVLKKPCSKTPGPGNNKITHLDGRPPNSPPMYDDVQPRPPSTKSAVRRLYEGTHHPNAVMDDPPAYETPR